MKLMIDIETLGVKPNSAILSIGAVAFDKNGIHDEFYVNVDLKSSLDFDYDIDPSTIYWWLSQDGNAGVELSKDLLHVGSCMVNLHDFIKEHEPEEIWANSPSFDLVMLKNAFEKQGVHVNWEFYLERDFRTFLSLTNAERVKPCVAHNALEGAKAQARTLINYWNNLQPLA